MTAAVGAGRLPTQDEVIAAAAVRFARIVREQDALTARQAAERAYWCGGPSVDAIEEHILAVRAARAARARGEDVPDLPPLTIERAAQLDAARAARALGGAA